MCSYSSHALLEIYIKTKTFYSLIFHTIAPHESTTYKECILSRWLLLYSGRTLTVALIGLVPNHISGDFSHHDLSCITDCRGSFLVSSEISYYNRYIKVRKLPTSFFLYHIHHVRLLKITRSSQMSHSTCPSETKAFVSVRPAAPSKALLVQSLLCLNYAMLVTK